MLVGLQLPSFTFPGADAAIRPTLTSIGQAAEANDFASLWVMDHFFQLPEDSGWGGPGEPTLEAYTTLGFLASVTDRIALGPMVANAVVRRRHCDELGRDYDTIEKTALAEADLRPGRQTVADVIAALRAQADEGIEHVIVNLPGAHVIEHLDTFGREIIPAVA